MALPGLADHVLAVAAPVAVTLYYVSIAALRFFVGMTATLSHDAQRAERALKVLQTLRWDWQVSPLNKARVSQTPELPSRCRNR